MGSKNISLVGIVLAVLLLANLALSWSLWPIPLVDDAYIAYRYASNIALHGADVFNLGEPVEGVTDLLWVLLLAAAGRCGIAIETAALGLGLLIYLICGVRLARLAQLLSEPGLAVPLVILCLPFGGAFGRVALNGLEGGLFAWLLTECAIALGTDRPIRLGLLGGLLFMTRPEGAAVGFIAALLVGLGTDGPGRRVGAALVGLGGFVIAVTVFRLSYFGAWLPNSVLAKSYDLADLIHVQRSQVLPYVAGFAIARPQLALPALIMAGLIGWAWISGRLRANWPRIRAQPAVLVRFRLESFALVALGLALLAVIRNGGDWMPDHRLIEQYLPCFVVLAAALARRLRFAWPALAALALVSIGIAVPQAGCCAPLRDERFLPGSDWAFWRDAADRLQPLLGPEDLVSTEAAGYIPYRLIDIRVHDPIGLLDPWLARHGAPAIPYGKVDFAYTLGVVRPSILVWHYSGHLAGLAPDLLANYVYYCDGRCDSRDQAQIVMVRRDRLTPAMTEAFADWRQWAFAPPG